jgi:Tfp pilus assembly protein FimT
LIKKLHSYGITGDLLHWLNDYVSHRKQKVFVNNECSNPSTVTAGVPQGPVLRSLHSLLCINDITDNLGNLARLFADDTSLSYSGRNYDVKKSDINNDLSKLNEWAKLWLVYFNPKKTKALDISTSAVPHLDLRFNGEPVEIVKNHKHLGITFTSDGNWTNHIDNIVNASLKQVNVLRKLKFTLSKQTLSNIYLTFIRPTSEYVCEVLDGCFKREVAKLEKYN